MTHNPLLLSVSLSAADRALQRALAHADAAHRPAIADAQMRVAILAATAKIAAGELKVHYCEPGARSIDPGAGQRIHRPTDKPQKRNRSTLEDLA